MRKSCSFPIKTIPAVRGMAMATRIGSQPLVWLGQIRAPPSGRCSSPTVRMGKKKRIKGASRAWANI